MYNLLLGTGALVAIIVAAVVVVFLIIFACWWISTHNKLVRLEGLVEESFSTMDVYLKKRYDLIPNLVETVKGYAKHESATFTAVTEARAAAMKATTTSEKVEANNQLSRAILRFNKVTENYPELKANVNFMDLQNQLKTVENEIANARKYYNATVRAFNTAILSIPTCIVAKRMKLEKKPYFEVSNEEERQNVKVQF